VKIIVDANMVFSGILNSNGKIGDLLLNSGKLIQFIAPSFLKTEIQNHYERICKISGMELQQVKEAEYQVCRNIRFISEEQIRPGLWKIAEKLVSDIDPNDTHYIAYSKHFRSKIWSGDKALVKGLFEKGFTNFYTTDELFGWREKKKR
jgi:predicted nucleic acid-binding protein